MHAAVYVIIAMANYNYNNTYTLYGLRIIIVCSVYMQHNIYDWPTAGARVGMNKIEVKRFVIICNIYLLILFLHTMQQLRVLF